MSSTSNVHQGRRRIRRGQRSVKTAMLFLVRMPWRSRVGLVLLIWLALEAVVLALVVKLVGVAGALLLGLATSLLGASMLKRLGASAVAGLRPTSGGLATLRGTAALDGVMAGAGALFLLLPGFLTDLVGLALAVPAVRGWAAQRIQRGANAGFPPRGPSTIDLGPEDWRPVDDRRIAPKA